MKRRWFPPGILPAISLDARGRQRALALAAALACAWSGCHAGRPAADAARPSPAASRPAAAPTTDARQTILFVGTSLTAGLGLDPEDAYPALVQRKVDAAGLPYRVVNAGVSGETSAGALRRIEWLLRQPVAVVVVETGANDGLRGHDPATTRDNIQALIATTRRRAPGARIALAGMEAPANFGPDYQRRFRAIYPELARKNGATLLPFLLEGVAGEPRLNQPDGIHPTAEGHRQMAENVWRALRPLL